MIAFLGFSQKDSTLIADKDLKNSAVCCEQGKGYKAELDVQKERIVEKDSIIINQFNEIGLLNQRNQEELDKIEIYKKQNPLFNNSEKTLKTYKKITIGLIVTIILITIL